MGDMKEIRDAALAYYYNLSKEQQHEVYTFFQAMDKDGDGAITIEEFEQILTLFSRDYVNRLFRAIDKNGDGVLDFEEAITFYYVLCTYRMVNCDGCKDSLLTGLYFTCVDCFDHNQTTTFDLCISCYRTRNYVHEHCNFVDNYALLRTRAAYINHVSTDQVQRTSSEKSVDDCQVPRSKSKKRAALKAINTSIDIGNTVGNVYAFFRAMDKDGDGSITIKEFEEILTISSRPNANRLFRAMDKNGDGVLDFEEAITFYYVLYTGSGYNLAKRYAIPEEYYWEKSPRTVTGVAMEENRIVMDTIARNVKLKMHDANVICHVKAIPHYREEDRKEMENQIQELLEKKLIRPSNSPHHAPAFLVRNHAEQLRGKARMVIDYRDVSKKTVKDGYQIAQPLELLKGIING
uniref:uncharacterized protein LOC105351293 n=1 Tax=Fragaria vesca subsp. vesca TaxID=101020 RepID=UPI0005C8E08A|nr:PREDICTED: uncharacterized protein LOC105351293 [Fragaria vesca subsp. vesca]